MKNLFKNNNFNTSYKKRPFDGYKAVVDRLDEETKKKLDRQRTLGMIIVVAVVFVFVAILAITGIGVDKTKSVTGMPFTDKETVLIECFGDSITKGDNNGEESMSYPKELKEKLPEYFHQDGHSYKFQTVDVKNYGMNGSVLKKDSYSRLSGNADIVIILYTVNNFAQGEDYEETLESNIDMIQKQGSKVFLLNYPILPGSKKTDILEQANNYISKVSKDKNVSFIDVNHCFSEYEGDLSELFSDDEIHLTEKGYMIMGDYVAESIHTYYQEQF